MLNSSVPMAEEEPEPCVATMLEHYALQVLSWICNEKPVQLISGQDQERAIGLSVVKFERTTKIITLIGQLHTLAVKNKSATQRELYYKAPDIFASQKQVNVLLQDIASLLRVPRSSLSVFASERGSVAGLLTFEHEGHALSCSSGSGVMISEALLKAELISTAKYIIVVEKDTVFQALCGQKFWNVGVDPLLPLIDHGQIKTGLQLLPCILLTGKGFPDISTRKLLVYLGKKLGLEAGYLGDYDPYGIQIFLTYQYGSKTFEGKQLAWPPLHWIGMTHKDMESLPPAALLKLGKSDEALLQGLLSNPGILNNERLLEECEKMKANGLKCEVEAMECHGGDFLGRNYVATRILRRTWI